MSLDLRRAIRWTVRVLEVLGLLLSLLVAQTTNIAQANDSLPPPHLGYGIHYGPNTSISPSLVDALGMDWVKIYEQGAAYAFPGKRILYRIDLHWPGDWTAFKNDVAARIQALQGMPIQAIEIGNEPNLEIEWGHPPNAWEYVQLLRVAYTVAKSIDPGLIVVSAGLAPTVTTPDRSAIGDLDYAEEMLANGAGQWFDAFGYHPYGYNLPPEADPITNQLVFRRTERIRALMEKYGVYKQVWLTEFGWLRDPGEDGLQCSDSDPNFAGFAWLRVSGATQADYLVRAFHFADQNWPWVGPMFVWNLNWANMKSVNMCSHTRWFSLLHADGTPTVAFQRLQAMEHRYSDYLPHLGVQIAPPIGAQTPTGPIKTNIPIAQPSDGSLVAGQNAPPAAPMMARVSLGCLHRTALGTFTITNSGYPTSIKLSIQPQNSDSPPFVEVQPTQARVGEPIQVFINPQGLRDEGQYPIYINIQMTFAKRLLSQTVQGILTVSGSDAIC